MDLHGVAAGARMKGLHIMGTGDFTHPQWINELKRSLKPSIGEEGLYSFEGIRWMLQTEISLIYTQDGHGRRIHHVILAPNFEVVDQINDWLGTKGRLDYDGRPTFGFSSIELTETLMGISRDIAIIPAHCWTPWYAIFGSKSGFDSIEECFGDQAKHIFAIETGMSCYDEETEILTEDGWKPIGRANRTDKVCTLNPETCEVEFQTPTKIHSYYHNGKMYRLRTKRVDLLVTPNHRLLYSPCDFRKPPKFVLKEAELLFNKSKRFKKDGIWRGLEAEYFTLPAVRMRHGSRYYSGERIKKQKIFPMKSWLKFFGFWIAEGWTTAGKDGDYGTYLSNTNTALLSEMKRILEGFGYGIYWDKKGNFIRVRDYQLFSYLKQFGKCYGKFVPSEIKSLSRELLEIFLEYYIKGDGHIYGRSGKGLSATTTSIRLRDDLQEIALKVGMSAYYKLHKKKGTPFRSPGQSYNKTYRQRNDSWTIYFIRKNIHTVLPSTNRKYGYMESWVEFNGPVYCITVPNHVIYVRRNGIPVWCGNSDPAMNWRLSKLDSISLVSNSDSHSPVSWRLGREANVFDLKKPSYRAIIDAIRTKKNFAFTIETPPAYGKYHWDGHRICNVSFSPAETRKMKGRCPRCGHELTIGVEYRVEELADRPEGFVPAGAVPFKPLIPLAELIAVARNVGVATLKVQEIYNTLISKFGTEFAVLLDAPQTELLSVANEKIVELILRNRTGKIKIAPGYDGVYGRPLLNSDSTSNLSEFLA